MKMECCLSFNFRVDHYWRADTWTPYRNQNECYRCSSYLSLYLLYFDYYSHGFLGIEIFCASDILNENFKHLTLLLCPQHPNTPASIMDAIAEAEANAAPGGEAAEGEKEAIAATV